jgi:hypothetical protein
MSAAAGGGGGGGGGGAVASAESRASLSPPDVGEAVDELRAEVAATRALLQQTKAAQPPS